MPSLECNKITWGRERPKAAGLRIQIPPGISRKGKHTQKKEMKNVTPRKSNQHQQLTTVRKPAALLAAAIYSLPCHSP